MRHVIVTVDNKEELEKLRLLLVDDDTNYVVIDGYSRSEWYSGHRCNRPHSAKIIGCKTKEEEFMLRLKFNTLPNPDTQYSNGL